MGKGKKKKPISPKKSIQSLQESRDGGQIALRGYTYQFLYACYSVSYTHLTLPTICSV